MQVALAPGSPIRPDYERGVNGAFAKARQLLVLVRCDLAAATVEVADVLQQLVSCARANLHIGTGRQLGLPAHGPQHHQSRQFDRIGFEHDLGRRPFGEDHELPNTGIVETLRARVAGRLVLEGDKFKKSQLYRWTLHVVEQRVIPLIDVFVALFRTNELPFEPALGVSNSRRAPHGIAPYCRGMDVAFGEDPHLVHPHSAPYIGDQDVVVGNLLEEIGVAVEGCHLPVKGLARAARSGDGVLDPTTRFEHAQRDIISPAPSVHFGQARQFPPVIDPPPLSIRPQDLVGGLVHRFLPSGHIAHKVHHITALPFGQRFPFLLGYLFASGPASVRYGDADNLYQPARPVGIGIAHGKPLRHKAGHIGGQQATGALAVEREDPLVFIDSLKRHENRKSELAVVPHQGQLFFFEEQQELEEGVA